MKTSYLMRVWVDVEDDGELRSLEARIAEAAMIESKLKVGRVMGITYPVEYACVEIEVACTNCDSEAYNCNARFCDACGKCHCGKCS